MVQLNKFTFTVEDDLKEIRYQKIEYIDNGEKITQNPKLQYTKISLLHKEKNTKEGKINKENSLLL